MSSDRSRKLGTAVLLSGTLTVAAAMWAHRGVAARRYVPRRFDANHIPPKFNVTNEALQAVGHATVLAGSSFAFFVSSAAWLLDVTTLREFGLEMKARFGTKDANKAPLDDPPLTELLGLEE